MKGKHQTLERLMVCIRFHSKGAKEQVRRRDEDNGGRQRSHVFSPLITLESQTTIKPKMNINRKEVRNLLFFFHVEAASD